MRRTDFIILSVVATCLLCLARPTLCDVNADDSSNKSAGESQNPKNEQKDKSAVVDSPKSNVVKPTNDNKPNDASAAVSAAGVVDTKTNRPGAADVTSNVQSLPSVKVKNAVGDTEPTSNAPEQPGIGHAASLNSGALLRGFYVFVGLSVIAVAYIVFRSFRLNKSRTQMVRKYGVLAHKQDIEMRPLPLDEDDEDDTTVFDVSGLSPPPRLQS